MIPKCGILARRQVGLTLVELLISVTVMAVVVAVALPSFQEATRNNLMRNTANDFATALNLARARAVETGLRARVCPTLNNSSCDSSGSYSDGYLVIVDADGDDAFEQPEIILAGAAMDSVVSLTAPSAFSQYIEFRPTGATNGTGQFDFCTSGYDQFSRLVNVTPNGRVTVIKQAGLCAES
jgi:type IV fimbrial biogenesis protein FimT